MALEDFTTAIEVDTNGNIVVTSATVITVTSLTRNDGAYVYWDKGVNFYSGDFIFTVDGIFTSATGTNGVYAVWALGNIVGDYISNSAGSSLSVLSSEDVGIAHNIHLIEYDSSVQYAATYVTAFSPVNRYFRVVRDEAVGTYGTIYLYIYSDLTRTDLLSTLSIALHTSKKDYRYLYAMQGHYNLTNIGTKTGRIENLDDISSGVVDAFLTELKKPQNQPNCVVEVFLDSGTVYWSYYSLSTNPEIKPILNTISTLQNKIDPQKGYTTRGQITFTISGRDNFKTLIQNNYLKNRRVNVNQGFIADGFLYTYYEKTFTGKIIDWTRRGDELTITVADDLAVDAAKNIPVENATKTQYQDFRNTHPVNIMTTMLQSTAMLGISTSFIDSTAFTNERDVWLQGWVFDRVITEPAPVNQYLNELQMETNSFIVHDGNKISYKVFAPATPGQTIEKYNDNDHLLLDSISIESGYKDNFFNRVAIYYDYDESNNENDINYESLHIATDAASQSTAQWSEVKTKIIKSKWLRSRTYTEPTNITGCIIYHCSFNNVIVAGSTLAQTATLTYDSGVKTLTWKPPSSSAAGAAVSVTKSGKYQLFGIDETKNIRVLVTSSSLPDYEDFTAAFRVDANNETAITSKKILTITNLDGVGDVFVGWDKGFNFYSGDFTHKVDVIFTSITGGNAIFIPWALGNIFGDYAANSMGSFLAIKSSEVTSQANYISIEEYDSSVQYYSTFAGALSPINYYFTVVRDEAVGTYGTIYLYTYSDIARTTLLSTLSIALHTSKKDYRYLYAMQGFDDVAIGTRTGRVENVDAGPKITSDIISVTNLNTNTLVGQLAQKILNRYRNPVGTIKFDLDINNAAWNSLFIKPTDLKDITTDEAFKLDESSWSNKRVMLTSIRPDFEKHKIQIEAIETNLFKKYGFIAPAGYPDYTTATAAQKEYAFIGNSSNQVNAGTENGYLIW